MINYERLKILHGREIANQVYMMYTYSDAYFNVYHNGALQRIDHSIFSDEGRYIVDTLSKKWQLPYDNDRHNLVGLYSNGKQVNWYSYKQPSDSVLESYKLSDHGYELLNLFNTKFFLDTNTTALKLHVTPSSYKQRHKVPQWLIDGAYPFFGLEFDETGKQSCEIDYYFFEEYDVVKSFCTSSGILYPFPDTVNPSTICVFGLSFNKDTLELMGVKGYTKHTYGS